MPVAKKFQIGAHEITVDNCSPYEHGFLDWGARLYGVNKIILRSDMCQSKKESTLLHEVIEEIIAQHSIDVPQVTVDIIAEGLYQFLKMNKLLKPIKGI